MGLFRFLFKWSLQITGSLIIGYNYGLKPQQQADLYGLYRSCNNTYRAGKEIYAALDQYKTLLQIKSSPEEYSKQLSQVNSNTAKRIEQLSRINRGVYMRLGQTIGFLKYAYPTEFYEVLKELNSKPNYQPEDYKYLKTHIQSQLGKKTRELFESLNTSPIKTELFSQIYKGQLAENFLDVNLKVINPYAKNQAKWDLWFLKKAFGYINDFKQKNFSESAYPLYLDQLYSNLEKNVEKELNFIEQQKQTKFVKQKLEALIAEEKLKTIPRNLPIYVPYVYSQYTKEKVMIQEYFEGYHLSNSDALIKENYNKKSISSDLISTWNGLIEKHDLLLESFTPADLFIRKSRANEEGQYQICTLNLTKNQIVPEFFVKPYLSLWKDYISSKKINPKKPEQRIHSIRSFYQNIAQVYFTLFLNDVKISNEVSLQYSLNPQSRAQLIEAAKQQLPKEMVNKMEANKLIPKSKTKVTVSSQSRNDYENLKRAFWIEFQPWKVQTLFETYKEIFREEKHFGVF